MLTQTVAASGAGVAAAASAATQQVVLEGTFRILAMAPLPGATLTRHDIPVLDVADKEYELSLPAKVQPEVGSRIRVTGELTGRIGDVGAEIVDVSSVAEVAGRSSAVAKAAPPTSGAVKVLVMLVQWTAPDGLTQASANAKIFTDTNNWYGESSYSQLSLTGSVTPWMAIAAPSSPCNTSDIMTKARNAATAAGFTPANFDINMAYFPSYAACSWAGLGAFASGDNWINGGSMPLRVTVHEMGHNFGLSHSHAYTCLDAASNPVTLDDPNRCTISDYGDPFDAMGAGTLLVGHFNAYQKNKLGWLGGSRVATLASGGSATLPPFETGVLSTMVARINVSATRTYWLEYRQATGVDAALPAGAVDGVLVHMYDSTVVNMYGPALLDARPSSPPDLNAALRFDTSWTSPDNWRISVGASGPSGVPVTATFISNDNFANNILIGGETATVVGTNVSTTKEAGEPNHAGNAGGRSVWYRWTPQDAGTVTIDTAGSTFNTLLGVYTGTAVNALTTIVSNDDVGGGNTTSTVSFPGVGGTTYMIAVDGFGGATGNLNLHIGLVYTPPPNDNFASPQVLTGSSGASTVVRTNAATHEAGEPDHVGFTFGNSKSAWYRWTAPYGGTVTIDTYGSTFNTILAVYTGSAVNALTQVAANESPPNGGMESLVTFAAVSGTTYQIAVDGFNGAAGRAFLNWALPPLNDNFANAQTLVGPIGQLTGSNVGSTKETGEPNHAFNLGSTSVWYSWTPLRGGSATIETTGSNFDTLLHVYTGTAVNALTSVVFNDDQAPGLSTSKLTFTAAAGTTYKIAVAGLNGVSGTVILKWKLPPEPPTDFDGDGKTDFGIFRPSNGAWYVAFAGGGSTSASWGASGDVPVPGDYNGDGKTDFGIFRPSTGGWYVAFTGGGATSANWGASTDVPLPLPPAIWQRFYAPA